MASLLRASGIPHSLRSMIALDINRIENLGDGWGWALATLAFTIKMTGVAKGEKLRARAGCCKPDAPTRSAPPMSMSYRRGRRRCAARCWPPRVIFRSNSRQGRSRSLAKPEIAARRAFHDGLVPRQFDLAVEARQWRGRERSLRRGSPRNGCSPSGGLTDAEALACATATVNMCWWHEEG
jgi:hypothetical protein